MSSPIRVAVIDDDESARTSLARLIRTGRIEVVTDMSRELALAITGLYRKREAHAVKSGSGGVSDLVFINGAGNPMDISGVRKRFIRVLIRPVSAVIACMICATPSQQPYSPRTHPLPTWRLSSGHAKPTTTLQHYARWLAQAGAGFVDRLHSFWHQSGPNRPHEPESEVLEIKKTASIKDIFW
jgi:hypothetical protein